MYAYKFQYYRDENYMISIKTLLFTNFEVWSFDCCGYHTKLGFDKIRKIILYKK